MAAPRPVSASTVCKNASAMALGAGGAQSGEVVKGHGRAHLHLPAADGVGKKARLCLRLVDRARGEHVVKAHDQAVFARGYVIGLQVGIDVVVGDAGSDIDGRAAALARLGKVDRARACAYVQSQVVDLAQRLQCVAHENHAPSVHPMARGGKRCAWNILPDSCVQGNEGRDERGGEGDLSHSWADSRRNRPEKRHRAARGALCAS